MRVFCCHGNQTKRQICRLLAFFNFPNPFYICTKLEFLCFSGFGGVVIKTSPYKFRVNWPRYFLPSFESVGLLVQVKKGKTDFQDGRHCSELGFPIGMISAIFDLQVTPMLPPSFKSMGLSFQEKKRGKILKMAAILDFRSERFLPIFYLEVTSMLPTKFRLNWPFGSVKEGNSRFSRWPPWRPFWISNRNDYS